ncbi:MAG: hypothetical protein TH68_01360 [Candidatus Synechococcus spongiarum 142]|uniref:Transposase DDE domain-containing protein n=1 Tax=Candidatus Synechococcus spongiarum 142 TaxID=1608213 RepID=A0A6N3X848_9SYNE|nr:MAG: hypothetical protein TH68_01360 [Candidatus Synechococcus spongiarum 142]
MPMVDKVLLHKRFGIKTLFEAFKSTMGLEPTRHHSPINDLIHILSCLAAYTLAQPKGKSGTVAIPNPMPTIPCNS